MGWLIGVSGGRGSSRNAAGTAVRRPEAWGPRSWLPARAPRSPRTRARLSAVFAFAFLPRALRKMKVAVSRACAAAVGARGAPCGAASLERASRSLSPHPARWR